MTKADNHSFLQHFIGKTIAVLNSSRISMGGGVFRGCEGNFLLFSEKENDETIAMAVSIDVVVIVCTMESARGKVLSMVQSDG